METPAKPRPYRFDMGEVVHHKRYGYRGVVYERDPRCLADEKWYQKNQTQPDRNQPWYHVLVDGSGHTTYVAECNLERDSTRGPVTHPLVGHFFRSFVAGRYYAQNLN